MSTILALLRHGRASGQGADAALLPEGAEYVGALGRHLAAEGWRPLAAFTSPLQRARESARIVLAETAPGLVATTLPDLHPECEPDAALGALRGQPLPAGRVLVVGHMPLLARLADRLSGEIEEFRPGTLVEIELEPALDSGRMLRRIGPEELGIS